MPWGRLDDGLYDHPKLDLLGRDRLAGVGLLTLAISWCNRRLTDGVVPLDRIRLLGGSVALADRLVAAGFFESHADGYLVHDFLMYNDSAEQVQARRDAANDRQRRHRSVTRDDEDLSQRESRPESRVSHGVTDGDVTAKSQRESRPSTRPHDRVRPGPANTDSESRPNEEIPPPPAERGRRDEGTNPRATGTAPRQTGDNPRANGQSPRQEREAQKRGPTAIGDVMREAMDRAKTVEAPGDEAWFEAKP